MEGCCCSGHKCSKTLSISEPKETLHCHPNVLEASSSTVCVKQRYRFVFWLIWRSALRDEHPGTEPRLCSHTPKSSHSVKVCVCERKR